MRIQTDPKGHFVPVGYKGWYPKGGEKARFDQQPIEALSPKDHQEEIWGIEDLRATRMETLDLWTVVYTAYSRYGPVVSRFSCDHKGF